MSGNYEFLCHMHGLSGASGLYTYIHALYQPSLLNMIYQVVTVVFGARYNPTNGKSQVLKRVVTIRSLDTLSQKYTEFLIDGGKLKMAKFHDNVIGERFFNISLTQVHNNNNKP